MPWRNRKLVREDEYWSVTVTRDGSDVITIARDHLAGRDLEPGDREVIRRAAEHLLSFIGAHYQIDGDN